MVAATRYRQHDRLLSLARLRSRSCIVDGEAVACDESGVPSFERIRFYRRHRTSVCLYAFDLIELNGDDLRNSKSARRRSVVAKAGAGIRFNEHLEAAGPTVIAHGTPSAER